MPSSAPHSTPVTLPPNAEPLLRTFPEEVRVAYLKVVNAGDVAAADVLIRAIVADHMPRKGLPLVDSAFLMRDLGFDSVSIAEMVFFFEDLLEVTVSNYELLDIHTVGQLRAFVAAKIVRPTPSRPASA